MMPDLLAALGLILAGLAGHNIVVQTPGDQILLAVFSGACIGVGLFIVVKNVMEHFIP